MKKLILSIAFLLVSVLILESCTKEDLNATSVSGSTSTNGNGTSGTTVGSSTSGTAITGTGSIISKTTDLASFSEINVSTVVKTEVVIGTSFKIETSDYENLLQYTKFEVKDNVLSIFIDEPTNTMISNTKSKAVITLPADVLKKLACSGAATITLKDSFNGLTDVLASGATVIMSSAVAKTNSINILASGSSQISFLSITAENVTVKNSGSSVSTFTITKTLNATLSGASTLSYNGDPIITKNISVASKLIKL